MCQVFSVVILLMLFGTTMIMSAIFLRCAGEQNWTYWILSITMSGLMGIASKYYYSPTLVYKFTSTNISNTFNAIYL